MRIQRNVEQLLRKLGLTTNEMKIYLLLLSQGPLTAKEISEFSGVPFSKVYLVLKNLENKGWITSIRERPIKYIAYSPTKAIRQAKVQREREWEEAAAKLIPILQPIYDARAVSEKPDVWIVHGEENVSSKALDLILKAETELLMAIHVEMNTLLKKTAEILENYLYRPLTMKVLIQKDLIDSVKSLIRYGVRLRYRDNLYGGGVISDTKEAMILLDENGRINTAIWSTHRSLILLAKLYFDRLWETSKAVEVA